MKSKLYYLTLGILLMAVTMSLKTDSKTRENSGINSIDINTYVKDECNDKIKHKNYLAFRKFALKDTSSISKKEQDIIIKEIEQTIKEQDEIIKYLKAVDKKLKSEAWTKQEK